MTIFPKTIYHMGSFIYYVCKVFRKTNISYPRWQLFWSLEVKWINSSFASWYNFTQAVLCHKQKLHLQGFWIPHLFFSHWKVKKIITISGINYPSFCLALLQRRIKDSVKYILIFISYTYQVCIFIFISYIKYIYLYQVYIYLVLVFVGITN